MEVMLLAYAFAHPVREGCPGTYRAFFYFENFFIIDQWSLFILFDLAACKSICLRL
jgi:hypothetical protein